MKAYSYIRWSSDPQTKGDSLKRQLERTRAVCRERNWELDESILPDMGVSAYSGKNLAKGSLAKFIDAVKSGRISTPCVLCVEGLDRLTRLRVRDAKALFDQLLTLNVQICTAHNNKVYDESSLDNPMDLLFSIMELNAGHTYAAELGRKISAAWTRKKMAAATGELLTSRVPAWIVVDKQKTTSFRVNQAKADIIKRIFAEYLDGKGARLIALGLNTEGIKPFGHGKGWSEITINRFLESPSVIGDLQPQKYISSTKRVPHGAIIENYYPAIVDKAIYYKVQERKAQRRTTKGARKHCFNLFSGLIKCEKCGWSVILKTGAVVKEGKKKPHVRLLCSKGWRGQGCEYRTIRYEQVERGVITGLTLQLLSRKRDGQGSLSSLENLEGDLKNVQAKITRLENVMLNEDDLPKTLVKSLAELEKLEVELKSKIALIPSSTNPLVVQWRQLPNTLENRIYAQGIMSNEIESIILNAAHQSGNVHGRNGSSFSLRWDENYEEGCFIDDRWQAYLDRVIFWESPDNLNFENAEILPSIEGYGLVSLPPSAFGMESYYQDGKYVYPEGAYSLLSDPDCRLSNFND